MPPALIVKRFEVFKERTLASSVVSNRSPSSIFTVEKNGFHHRVVETITATTHTARDV
jgi:hypothetical protein